MLFSSRSARRARIARQVTAYHVAADAVIARVLGCPVERVSIDEDGGGAAQIKWSDGDERRIEFQILVALAGPYSYRRFAPRSRWRRHSNHARVASGDDFDSITNVIYKLHGRGKVADKYRAYMEARAEALVDRYWRHIENVANALLEHGTITDDIRNVFPERAGPPHNF
jgi:hypothetical protein